MTEQILFTPIEAINEYYRLKDKYESGYYDKYVKPIIKSNISKKDKRIAYSKLPKHECINCKRNVGTIWNSYIDPNENIKYFKAKCGDTQDSCPLDIQINYAVRLPIDKEIKLGLEHIDKIKLDIIKEKNNSLFFKKDVTHIFNELTEKLKLETETTGFIIETDILRNNNTEKELLLKKTINEFGQGFVLPFKQMISDFNETGNELMITQAINFYINEIIPKLKEIQSLKYDVNMVEFDENNHIYKLIQLINSEENKEFYFKADDKVVNFIRGMRKEKKKTRKEEPNPKLGFSSKKKTRKILPKDNIVLIDDDVEDNIEDDINIIIDDAEITPDITNKYGETKHIKPLFNKTGNVTWNNTEYDNTWKKMPQNLKTLLLQDHNWLEDYMNSCINLRKQGKPCELFLPNQTHFPPEVDNNGKYDFGSDIVNKLFNGLNKQHQEILLTTYSIKDGVNNYDTLKHTLATMLTKQLNIEPGYF